MIKINSTTYISFIPVNYKLVWAGWDYTCWFGFIVVYKKSLLK